MAELSPLRTLGVGAVMIEVIGNSLEARPLTFRKVFRWC